MYYDMYTDVPSQAFLYSKIICVDWPDQSIGAFAVITLILLDMPFLNYRQQVLRKLFSDTIISSIPEVHNNIDTHMQSESVAEFASCDGLENFFWSHVTVLQGLEQRIQRLSQILSLADLSQKSQIYMPLSPPSKLKYAVWPQNSLYHQTALCSAFVDTATLPFRTSNNTIGACSFQTCLASMVSILNPFSRLLPIILALRSRQLKRGLLRLHWPMNFQARTYITCVELKWGPGIGSV